MMRLISTPLAAFPQFEAPDSKSTADPSRSRDYLQGTASSLN